MRDCRKRRHRDCCPYPVQCRGCSAGDLRRVSFGQRSFKIAREGAKICIYDRMVDAMLVSDFTSI